MPPTQRHTHTHINLRFHATQTEWVNLGTTVRSNRGERMRIQWQQAGHSLQAIMQMCHPCSTSFTSTSTRAAINSSPSEFLRSPCKFQSPDFFPIDPICAAWLKAGEAESVAEDGITPQPTTSGHKKSHSVICASSCIHLAFIRLVINRPLASRGREQTVSALAPDTAYWVSVTFHTEHKLELCLNKY